MNRFGKDIDDKLSEREILMAPAPMTTYSIAVYTGNQNGAGTDSSVHVTLFGEKVL